MKRKKQYETAIVEVMKIDECVLTASSDYYNDTDMLRFPSSWESVDWRGIEGGEGR